MANTDIRNAAGGHGIRLWQVAEAIGMNESAFSRKLRKELQPEEKKKVLAISHSFAAACGVSDRVLWQTLKDRPYITKVCICLDNDEPGQKAVRRISQTLADKNICNRILVPTRKDWNEDLLFLREEEAK